MFKGIFPFFYSYFWEKLDFSGVKTILKGGFCNGKMSTTLGREQKGKEIN